MSNPRADRTASVARVQPEKQKDRFEAWGSPRYTTVYVYTVPENVTYNKDDIPLSKFIQLTTTMESYVRVFGITIILLACYLFLSGEKTRSFGKKYETRKKIKTFAAPRDFILVFEKRVNPIYFPCQRFFWKAKIFPRIYILCLYKKIAELFAPGFLRIGRNSAVHPNLFCPYQRFPLPIGGGGERGGGEVV